MCEADLERRDWRLYVRDMCEFSEKVLTYTEGLDLDAFVDDSLTYDATLRNIELIGEVATHVPSEVREANPEIQWRQIIGTRNQVAHAYLGLDDDVIWDIICTDIPRLLPLLRRLLETAGEGADRRPAGIPHDKRRRNPKRKSSGKPYSRWEGMELNSNCLVFFKC